MRTMREAGEVIMVAMLLLMMLMLLLLVMMMIMAMTVLAMMAMLRSRSFFLVSMQASSVELAGVVVCPFTLLGDEACLIEHLQSVSCGAVSMQVLSACACSTRQDPYKQRHES